jgi:hypothetical protein
VTCPGLRDMYEMEGANKDLDGGEIVQRNRKQKVRLMNLWTLWDLNSWNIIVSKRIQPKPCNYNDGRIHMINISNTYSCVKRRFAQS